MVGRRGGGLSQSNKARCADRRLFDGSFWTWSIAVLCPSFVAILSDAHAQSPPSIGLRPEDILRLPQSVRVAQQSLGDRSCPLSDQDIAPRQGETADLTIRSVVLGAPVTVAPAREIDAILEKLRGATLSTQSLGRAAELIGCVYRTRGFIFARADIVATDEAGAYRVAIAEGRVASIEVVTETTNNAAFILRAFSAVQRDAPLNVDDVRFGLSQAANLGVGNVRPTIRRNRVDPTAIDLILVVDPPAHEAFVSVQNNNVEAIGSWGITSGVRLRGLTPLYETTTIGAFSTPDFSEQRVIQVSSEALLTGSGLRAKVDAAYAQTQPDGELSPLDLDARAAIFRLELTHPVIVRRGLIGSARASFETVDQTTRFLDDVLFSDDSLRIGAFGVHLDAVADRLAISTDLSFRRGFDLLGASEAGETNLSRIDANPQAWNLRGEIGVAATLPYRMSAQIRARGQFARDPLPAFEEFAFGQLTGGRGVDPAAIVGDRGVAVTGELAYTAPALPFARRVNLTAQPFVFVDAARAWDISLQAPDAVSDIITGGVGVRLGLFRRAQFELVWANPLGNINGAPSTAAGPRVLVQFSSSFDFSFRDGFFKRGSK